jgi:hypothetical protein
MAIINRAQKLSQKNDPFILGYFIQSIDDDQEGWNLKFPVAYAQFPWLDK